MSAIGPEPEGATPLDPDELEGLKFKHIATRAQLDELEQANVEQGLVWIARRRKSDVLNERFVRELHKRLFGDVWSWAGAFRNTEKNIGIDPFQIRNQLPYLLDDARYWVEHETYEPLEAAVRFHHRLVEIHCFPNGNGRHARIMSDIYLQENWNHPPIDWAGGHDLMKDNSRRKDYIAALRAADRNEFKPLFQFVGSD